MIRRRTHVRTVLARLRDCPVVGILGARQAGKTTLARQVVGARRGPAAWYDLESDRDVARLRDPLAELERRRGLVVLDEIQRAPELFTALRVLADRPRRPARFLILGSAAPHLLRQSSESLAGRVHYHELDGFSIEDLGPAKTDRLWRRGGFPRSFLATSEARSLRWRADLVRDYLHRELPDLGVGIPPESLRRFWTMIAHHHGQIVNFSELGRSFGMNDMSARKYLDLLVSMFLVRLVQPWHENLAKRQVKAPKVYIRDSGILHALLGIRDADDLSGHPKVGASWEGFALEETLHRTLADGWSPWFWATHQGAELDLLLTRGRRRLGFEFKRHSAPTMTKSMHVALADLGLERLWVIHPGPHRYRMADRVEALPLLRIGEALRGRR